MAALAGLGRPWGEHQRCDHARWLLAGRPLRAARRAARGRRSRSVGRTAPGRLRGPVFRSQVSTLPGLPSPVSPA